MTPEYMALKIASLMEALERAIDNTEHMDGPETRAFLRERCRAVKAKMFEWPSK